MVIISCEFFNPETFDIWSESWSSLAVFVCSIALTTTILQGSDAIRDWWKKHLEDELKAYATRQVKNTYKKEEFPDAVLDMYMAEITRRITHTIIQYVTKDSTEQFWKNYTKQVYGICIVICLALFLQPHGIWRFIYLVPFYPLLDMAQTLWNHKRDLMNELNQFIEDEDSIKQLLTLTQTGLLNIPTHP